MNDNNKLPVILPPQDQVDREYILNDHESPLPVSGPRIVVGFWTETIENPAPDLSAGPQFTICYPVGNGETCYFWKHVVDYAENDIHPNSMRHGEWLDGHFRFTQFTTSDCSITDQNTGTIKTAHWTRFRDMPPYLLGRILNVFEIPVDRLRQHAVILLRAADGHHVTLDDEDQLVCGSREVTTACELTAVFPDFVDDEDGGSGDDGAFALRANNGLFLQTVARCNDEGEEEIGLNATAGTLADAQLFTLELLYNQSACLTTVKDPYRLRHPCPGDRLVLTRPSADPFEVFTIRYR